MKWILMRLTVACTITVCAIDANAACTVTCAAVVPATGTAGSPVQFQAAADPCGCTNPPTFQWNFGDGDTSSAQNPSHTYSSNGNKNWSLTTTADGVQCTKSGTISIGGVTPAAGTYTGTQANGDSISITVNGSSQITSYSIGYTNFCSSTGSTTQSTTCNITNGSFTCGSNFCAPFVFTVRLTGSFTSSTSMSGTASLQWQPSQFTGCCSRSQAFSTSGGTPSLTATAQADTPNGLAPLTVNFTGNYSGGVQPYTFNWDFGDCTPPNTSQSPSHTYAAGNWNAIFTVTDGNNSKADAIVPITATSPAPTHFIVSAPANAAAGTPFTVTVTAKDAAENTSSYTGTIAFSSNDPAATLPSNYTFTGGDAGVHTFTNGVTLNTVGARTVSVADGSVTGSANVSVGHGTTTSVTSAPNPTAPGASVTFTASVTSSGGTVNSGTVTFKEGEVVLGSGGVTNGTASYSTAALAGGPHPVVGDYSGGGSFAASTSAPHQHYVLLPAPTVTATAGSGTNGACMQLSIVVSWNAVNGAVSYEVQKSTNNSTFSSLITTASTAVDDCAVSANTAYFYKVRAKDAGGNYGFLSTSDPATTVLFTDEPVIKAAHITHLRSAVNAMRAAAAMGAGSFTDPTIVAGMVMKAAHIQDLRTALNAARSALGLAAITYTDPGIAAGVTIKAAHISDLRNGVK